VSEPRAAIDAAGLLSVLATSAVRDAVKPRFAWSNAGQRRFKGVRDEVRLYRARPAASAARAPSA
jgi:class 3 adenylate cyclase